MFRYNLDHLNRNWHGREERERSFKKVDLDDIFINFAKAGFFFLDGSVHCFSCLLRIDDWLNIRKPLITHCLYNPKCKFLIKQLGYEGVHDILTNYKRNFDEKSFLCVVCKLNFIDRFLFCGHTFCSHCLKRLQNLSFDKSDLTEPPLKCPICRVDIINQNETMGPGTHPQNN